MQSLGLKLAACEPPDVERCLSSSSSSSVNASGSPATKRATSADEKTSLMTTALDGLSVHVYPNGRPDPSRSRLRRASPVERYLSAPHAMKSSFKSPP